jgi:hypothetical protein
MLNVFFKLFSILNASSLFNTQFLFSMFLYKWGFLKGFSLIRGACINKNAFIDLEMTNLMLLAGRCGLDEGHLHGCVPVLDRDHISFPSMK